MSRSCVVRRPLSRCCRRPSLSSIPSRSFMSAYVLCYNVPVSVSSLYYASYIATVPYRSPRHSVRSAYRRAAVEEESEFEFFMPLRSFLDRTVPAADMTPVHAFMRVCAYALNSLFIEHGTFC